jgi:hypothetical protein
MDSANDLADHTGMGNQRDPTAWMIGRDAFHGRNGAVTELAVALPSRPTKVLPILPFVLLPQLWKFALYFAYSKPISIAAIDLLKAGTEMKGAEPGGGYCLRCVARAGKGTRVDSIKWRATRQIMRKTLNLSAAFMTQRYVGPSRHRRIELSPICHDVTVPDDDQPAPGWILTLGTFW